MRLEPELRTGGAELREPELRRTALPDDRLEEPELRRTALPEERLEPELRVAVRPLLLRDGGGRLTEDRVGALRCTVERDRVGADRVLLVGTRTCDRDVELWTGVARRVPEPVVGRA